MEGAYLIGARRVTGGKAFRGLDAATGAELAGDFPVTTAEDLETACRLADAAFDTYRETAPAARAAFLEAIAEALEARREAIVERCMAESGLPAVRLNGELGRTTGQLRMFAQVVREGDWADVVIDKALPQREPLPRPDLRARRIAVGPVAVFGASNFPLAFSVAGGDTASALAAGCPVVVKAHQAHPGTSLLAGEAIQEAVAKCGLPEGVFSLVYGPGNEIGTALVRHPAIRAVGFTGSRGGGTALMAAAAARPEPIPVYAEMSSVNPVILMPGALAANAEGLAKGYVASLSLFAGQFCTNPGMVFALAGSDVDGFEAAAAEAMGNVAPQVMLTSGILSAYEGGSAKLAGAGSVTEVAQGQPSGERTAGARLFATDAASLMADPALSHEVFGPSSLVVRCADMAELTAAIADMEGQLTATIHAVESDHASLAPLMPLLERKAGRILFNGWPTGVEVCRSMVHGGPFPATSDPRTTSVGAMAIERFLRPVCYQAVPDTLLPAPLKEANPLGLPRRAFD
ncbi:aldehyde dehydrogenase (NADP(+)) [Novosphingobium flavum]|uniref:2,5-dioxovalerate dehydrogenase n=1 Tax=Novosphingobium flavum TaxID=1778672 RepID=A0A7X1KLV9_9SPHN|nr:aldehyde dehydrogenase (NADP(+)) [Novosphingobium flavum]MBC2665997.1 aldehyde dehydrogenase (NADP(+)) [Novosphingobium flavum]